MKDEVSLGNKFTHRLVFDNLEKNSWGEPIIKYEADTLFGIRSQELKDYQMSALIDLMQQFIVAKKKYKEAETKKLKNELEKIKKSLYE